MNVIPSTVKELKVNSVALTFQNTETSGGVHFHASISGYDAEFQDENYYDLAFLTGAIVILPERLDDYMDLDLDGNLGYSHDTLINLYSNGKRLNYKLWDKIGGYAEDTRVIYIDQTRVNTSVSCRNLGVYLVVETIAFIDELLLDEKPVVSILGAYDREINAEAVLRYFQNNGFKPLKKRESGIGATHWFDRRVRKRFKLGDIYRREPKQSGRPNNPKKKLLMADRA